MKAKTQRSWIAALLLTAASSSTWAGPILIFQDVKQPSLVTAHFSSESWIVEETSGVTYHENGITANGQSYSWDSSGMGRVFLTYTADGEPTSASYVGAQLGSDDTRSLLRGPFASDPGQFFSSTMLAGTQHSQLVFISQPRVFPDPADHSVPGSGVITGGTATAKDGSLSAPLFIGSAEVPEPSTLALVLLGLYATWIGSRFRHYGRVITNGKGEL